MPCCDPPWQHYPPIIRHTGRGHLLDLIPSHISNSSRVLNKAALPEALEGMPPFVEALETNG
jgi:hypothetical protein